jgi:hypothetical protein
LQTRKDDAPFSGKQRPELGLWLGSIGQMFRAGTGVLGETPQVWQTRREVLKAGAAGSATVLISRLLPIGAAPEGEQAAVMNPPGSWSGPLGEARYRIDGLEAAAAST